MRINYDGEVVNCYNKHKKELKEYYEKLLSIKNIDNQNITLERMPEIIDWFLNFMCVINKLCASLYYFINCEDIRNYDTRLCRNFEFLECEDYSEGLQNSLNTLLEYVNRFYNLISAEDTDQVYRYFKIMGKEEEFFVGISCYELISLRDSIWNEIQNILSNIICANCPDNARTIIEKLNVISFPHGTLAEDMTVKLLFNSLFKK